MADKRDPCAICQRDPQQVNNDHAECSVVGCPHRRRCWSERAGCAQHQGHARAPGLDRQVAQLFDRVEV